MIREKKLEKKNKKLNPLDENRGSYGEGDGGDGGDKEEEREETSHRRLIDLFGVCVFLSDCRRGCINIDANIEGRVGIGN